MNRKRSWRSAGALLCLLFIITAALLFLRSKEIQGSQAELISPEEISLLEKQDGISCRELLTWQGKAVPFDKYTKTLYLNYSTAQGNELKDILPLLRIDSDVLKLYFAEDEFAADLSAAVKENHSFRIVIKGAGERYTEFKAVLTPLPVITLNGELLGTLNDGDEQRQGKIRIYSDDGCYFENWVNWHLRGNASRNWDKKCWKLNLIDGSGHRADGDILGMGKDDDWLLNPMGMDDLKVRERLFMRLWNQHIEDGAPSYIMSDGEYAELLIDDRYQGLYFIHRRVEPGLMGLDDDELLFRGWQYTESFKLVQGPGGKEEEALVDAANNKGMLKNIDPDNFTDLSLMLEFAAAVDNYSWRNTFYVYDSESGSVKLVPWDTDISFGFKWNDDTQAFEVDPVEAANFKASATERYEMDMMLEKYPDLKDMMQARWQELRAGVLDYDNIIAVISELRADLGKSGALMRDEQRWGLRFDGADTQEGLELYIREKLKVMDERYSLNK